MLRFWVAFAARYLRNCRGCDWRLRVFAAKLTMMRKTAAVISAFCVGLGLAMGAAYADAPKGTPTGVLDLSLVSEPGGKYQLTTEHYQLAFRQKPSVAPQDTPSKDGKVIKGAMALTAEGNNAEGLFLVPVPKEMSYDVKGGIVGTRDGMIKNVGATIVKEETATLGGIPGIKVFAKGEMQKVKFELYAWLVFDNAHRTMIGLMVVREAGKPNDAGKAFADGFIRRGAKQVQTGFEGIVIDETADTRFKMSGRGFSIAFAQQPKFETFEVPWPTGPNKGGTAMAEAGNGANGVFLTYVPEGVSYDEQKGFDGARTEMFKKMNVTLKSEKPATIAGQKGRTAFGSMELNGKPVTVRASFVYLKKQRCVFGVLGLWVTGDKPAEAEANAFVKSLKFTK